MGNTVFGFPCLSSLILLANEEVSFMRERSNGRCSSVTYFSSKCKTGAGTSLIHFRYSYSITNLVRQPIVSSTFATYVRWHHIEINWPVKRRELRGVREEAHSMQDAGHIVLYEKPIEGLVLVQRWVAG
ncbi:hypothetical protein F5890DRAFT_1641796 [Lentinula detonsa]|uniref:Uncharacterized protein n=1 Tax=Lentinula detonsa TaxID=2804962 RepID=A0AA38PP10_9AGAR|nr:hypothetical protein F5890DRAFT_1641796 [Lentinula detonsa]